MTTKPARVMTYDGRKPSVESHDLPTHATLVRLYEKFFTQHLICKVHGSQLGRVVIEGEGAPHIKTT